MDRQQQKAERLPQVISAPKMGLLMGNDILPAAAVHMVRQIDLRADRPKHERRVDALGLINIAPQADGLADSAVQAEAADRAVQKQRGSSGQPDPREDRPD